MSKKINVNIPDKERPNLLSLFKTYVKRKVKEEEERWEKYHRSRHYDIYDEYDSDEYAEEMAQLRRFYGGCFPHSGGYTFDDFVDDEWDDDDYDDYYVEDDGSIVFPPSNASSKEDLERTLRPGEVRKSRTDMDDYWNKLSKFNSNGKRKHTKHRGKRGNKHNNISEPYNANFIDDNGDIVGDVVIWFYPDYHDKYDKLEFNSLYEFDKYCAEEGYSVPPYIGETLAFSPVSHCCLNPIAKDAGVLEIMRCDTYGDMFYEACETNELSTT